MKIAVSSDEKTAVTTAVIADLEKRGHAVALFGAVADGAGDAADWPVATGGAAAAVAGGGADEAVVFCWTGTGASIAANKVAGVRAALCGDAETARGARKWNRANVLALSLRATTEAVAAEILEAWFATAYLDDEWNRRQIERVGELERANAPAAV